MKIDNNFIEININDPGRFTDIALLFDRSDFQKKITELRDKYKIIQPSKDTYRDFYIKLTENKITRKSFNEDINSLLFSYKLPPHFKKPIIKALLTNTIEDYDYKKAYLEKKDFPNQTKYSIVIFSNTRQEDVDEIFSEFSKLVRAQKYDKARAKRDKPFMFGYWQEFKMNQYKDTRNEIIQIRKWYMLYKKDCLTPTQIALRNRKLNEAEYKTIRHKLIKLEYKRDERPRYERLVNGIEVDRKNITTQIRRYRKLLEG
jgi:hypothetical protein